MFEVIKDGVSQFKTENTKPTRFENVTIFTGGKFYPAANAKIKNLKISMYHVFLTRPMVPQC